MFMPHSAGRLIAETRQMAFSGQRPQVAPSMTYAPSETNWSAKYGFTAPSVMAALGRWARSLARQPLRAKFFVQPMTAVVAPPYLSAHKPTGNCASGDDDRPHMPSSCHCGWLDQSKSDADRYHRSLLWAQSTRLKDRPCST